MAASMAFTRVMSATEPLKLPLASRSWPCPTERRVGRGAHLWERLRNRLGACPSRHPNRRVQRLDEASRSRFCEIRRPACLSSTEPSSATPCHVAANRPITRQIGNASSVRENCTIFITTGDGRAIHSARRGWPDLAAPAIGASTRPGSGRVSFSVSVAGRRRRMRRSMSRRRSSSSRSQKDHTPAALGGRFAARAAAWADAMHVALGDVGEIEVDDVRDPVDVDAARAARSVATRTRVVPTRNASEMPPRARPAICRRGWRPSRCRRARAARSSGSRRAWFA